MKNTPVYSLGNLLSGDVVAVAYFIIILCIAL